MKCENTRGTSEYDVMRIMGIIKHAIYQRDLDVLEGRLKAKVKKIQNPFCHIWGHS
jgi:hypothetical protein